MKPSLFWSLLASILFVQAPVSRAIAESAEKLKAEAGALMEKARDLKAEGRFEESQNLADKAKQLEVRARELAASRKDGPDRDALREKLGHLQVELNELHAAGRTDEAAEVQRRIHKIMNTLGKTPEGRPPESGAPGRESEERERAERPRRDERAIEPERLRPPAERRLEHRREATPGNRMPMEQNEGSRRERHVRKAIEHLHAAGLHEPAERLEQKLGAFRGEHRGQPGFHQPPTPPDAPRHAGPGPNAPEMERRFREFQEQLDQLRRMNDELRNALDRLMREERRRGQER